MEIAHHHRVRVRAQRGAEQIVSVGDIGDPIAHRFADGVFERAAAGVTRFHLGAQQAHTENVEALPPHVLFAHVDDAVESEQRAHGGRSDAVLPGAGLGDDAALAHAAGQQGLAEALLILCAPVCSRSSRFSQSRAPPMLSLSRLA